MAERDADEVAQILSRGYQSVIANRQFQQEQAEKVREAQANEQARKDQLAQQQSQFEATQAASEKLFKLGQARDEFNQAMQSVPYGITPPGMVEAPVGPNAPPPDQRMRYLIGPSGQTAAIPSVGMYNAQQAAAEAAKQGPQLDLFRKENEIRQADLANQMAVEHGYQTERDQAEADRRAKEQASQFNYNKQLEQMRLDSQMSLARYNMSVKERMNALNKANILGAGALGGTWTTDADGQMTFVPGGGPDATAKIKTYIDAGMQGTMSAEDLKTAIPDQKVRGIVADSLAQGGGKFLANKERDDFQNLNKISQIVPELKTMYDIMDDPYKRFTAYFFPTSDAAKQFKAAQDIVTKNIPVTITALTGMKRYNSTEAEKVVKGMIPNLSPLTANDEAEKQKRDDFIKHDIQDNFDYALSKVPEQQRKVLRNTLNVPDLRNALIAPGVEHPTAPGNTPAGTNIPPPKPGEVLVYNKQLKRKGYENLRYVTAHPELYQVLSEPGK